MITGISQAAGIAVEWIKKVADAADEKVKNIYATLDRLTAIKEQGVALFEEFKTGLLLLVLPYLMKVVDAVGNWLDANQDLIHDWFECSGIVFKYASWGRENFLKFIDRFVGWGKVASCLWQVQCFI